MKGIKEMSKKIKWAALLYCSIAANVSADVIKSTQNNLVKDIDIDAFLSVAPAIEQQKLLENKEMFIKQLEQLYIKKALAKDAVDEKLDQEPIVKARLKSIVDDALFILKLDAIKRSNNKDYTHLAKQLYKVKKSDYKTPNRVDAAHILIMTKDRSDEKALEKIMQLRKEIVKGAPFSKVADRESEDKSVKRNHGELGTFAKEEMVKPFSDTVFAMKEGELSEPVKTQYGYHLIKLNKKVPAGFRSFDEVKSGIMNQLAAKDWKNDRAAYFDNVKKDDKMKIDDKALGVYIEKKLKELETELLL